MIVYGISSEKYIANQGNDQNGAYYYSKEIEETILPEIKAEVLIFTAGGSLYRSNDVPEGAVVVCHDNHNPHVSYKNFMGKDVLWICSKNSTVKKLISKGEEAVYIPLSIDTEYVKKFTTKKTEEIAFVGNAWSFKRKYLASLPEDIKQLSGMPRRELLTEMAKYKRVIAEGRCLMEAQVLGAIGEIPDYQDATIGAEFVEPLDNRETIVQWRNILTEHAKETPRKFLRCVKRFEDLESGKQRAVGEVFSASPKRAKQILNYSNNLAEPLA